MTDEPIDVAAGNQRHRVKRDLVKQAFLQTLTTVNSYSANAIVTACAGEDETYRETADYIRQAIDHFASNVLLIAGGD